MEVIDYKGYRFLKVCESPNIVISLNSTEQFCNLSEEGKQDLLNQAYEHDGYDSDRAGIDFWLTRNGHGAGFWDRGLGEVGDQLTKKCDWQGKFGERNLYIGDDGKIYHSH